MAILVILLDENWESLEFVLDLLYWSSNKSNFTTSPLLANAGILFHINTNSACIISNQSSIKFSKILWQSNTSTKIFSNRKKTTTTTIVNRISFFHPNVHNICCANGTITVQTSYYLHWTWSFVSEIENISSSELFLCNNWNYEKPGSKAGFYQRSITMTTEIIP